MGRSLSRGAEEIVTECRLPRFACPECSVPLESSGELTCGGCNRRFEQQQGIYRFLTAARLRSTEPQMHQYRLVREREGYRVSSPEYYRMLPCVRPDDPHAAEWRIRRESFQHLLRWALPLVGSDPIRVLDVGAGNGWLSHRLAELGHEVAAVDCLDDDEDGLGACRHYATTFARIQADFDALPLAPAQFDLVVFNGSLHYSPNVCATLAQAHRVLAPGGTLVAMDSPTFRHENDGHAMVAEKLRRFRSEYGLSDIVHPSIGFLTLDCLAKATVPLGLSGRFLRSRGPLGWRARRELAWIRLRRAPAAFGVWIAR
jgi:SAM-dependent methyltransferase